MIEKIINIEQMEEMRHNALRDPMISSISFERYDDNHVRVRVVTSDYPIHKQCSIIRWTRYDGTVETLPDENNTILSYYEDVGIYEVELFFKKAQGKENVVVNGHGENKVSKVKVGWMWSYLPTPEGV